MNPKELALKIAQKLFPAPAYCLHWCDDGFGGIDQNAVANRQREKAALIEPYLRLSDDRVKLYEALVRDAMKAAAFMHEERESLGLHLGQCVLVDGIPALRRQRDALRLQLEAGRVQRQFDRCEESPAGVQREAQLRQRAPKVRLKSGAELTAEECREALDAAMTIIEAVGTTGIHSRVQAAGQWMRKFYPQWA